MKLSVKRSLAGLLIGLFILIWGSASISLQAAPVRQATAPAGFGQGALVRVKASKPFVWLRSSPSSTAGVVDTAPSGDFLVIEAALPNSDGAQNWWRVRRGGVFGFVEQDSIELVIAAPTATTPPPPTIPPTVGPTVPPTQPPPVTTQPSPGTNPAAWGINTLLRVKPSKIFAWLRASPSSFGVPADYAPGGDLLYVMSATPQSDGLQWWWRVRRAAGSIVGWVEQDSVELAGAVPPTAAPPTATLGTGGPLPAPVNWNIGQIVAVRPGIRFVWLRSDPVSNARVVGTIYTGWLGVVADATPRWDGRQWWSLVRIPILNVQGWIEQASLY
jgi:hypothetical protein